MLRLHDFRCETCAVIQESVVEGEETPDCPVCKKPMVRMPAKFRVNMGPVGAHGYYDETLCAYVSTNKQRRELCRQQGVTPKGDTPKPDGEAWF